MRATPSQPGEKSSLSHVPRPAGFFSRFEAFVIDLVILSIVQLVASAFIQTVIKFFKLTGLITRIQGVLDNSTFELITGSTLMAIFVIAYFTFFWTLVGYTPGKALLGLKVVHKSGKKISFFRALLRFISYWVSAIPLFLGFFWVLWDSKRQAWHDKIAGTQVIYIPKKPRR
jgi:uncharacterized RDD family membrane protein YckC